MEEERRTCGWKRHRLGVPSGDWVHSSAVLAVSACRCRWVLSYYLGFCRVSSWWECTNGFDIHCLHGQSCVTLCDPMDYSLPGSPVHGIFQARILEWVAVSSCRVSSLSRDRTHISFISCLDRLDSLPLSHLRGPERSIRCCQMRLKKPSRGRIKIRRKQRLTGFL